MSLPTGDRIAFNYPEQAAAAIGASVHLIATAVNNGRLATHKAGANKIVLRRDLEAFAASLPTTPKAKPEMSEAETAAARARGRAVAERHLGKRS